MRAVNYLVAAAGALITATSVMGAVVAQIEVIASDDSGVVGSHVWTTTVGADGSYSWGPGSPGYSPVTFSNGSFVESVSFGWIHDPQVTSSFNVTSGITQTTFTINSALLSFDPIASPIGVASAFIGVTNSSFGGNTGSITLNGLHAGGAIFAARANGNADTFASLIAGPGTVAVAPGLSVSYVGANPSNPGYDIVPFAASDMQSQFKFSLSSFDSASGTSTYEIIPAPGAAALLGLGGLVALRRRRS